MEFHIQDPDDPGGVYLLDAIVSACEDAERGGGIFSFASPNGAKLLLEDKTFRNFAKRGTFALVIGIDAVTTVTALDVISAATADLPGATVRAFLNDRGGTLFHPKMCWFAKAGGGRLIVGSGNLTGGGLRDNWESFTVSHLDVAQTKSFERWWKGWIERQGARLLPLDDERIRDRASKNVPSAAGKATAAGRATDTESGEPVDVNLLPPPTQSQSVLIAEIPGQPPPRGTRWEQANFDKDNFTLFFGATPGEQICVFFQSVTLDGKLGEVESRPSVAVKSRNYRFELGAAKGRAYPAKGRPIGVFVEVATRQFVYQLVMPDDEYYPSLDAFLAQRWAGRADRMRRRRVKADELQKEWQNEPFWRAIGEAPRKPSV